MKTKGLVKLVIGAFALVTTCVGFTGCMDDVKDVYKGKTSEEPNTFSFSTKKTVGFTLKYDVPTGYRVHFEMYSKSPITLDQYKSYVKDSTLIPFFSGLADENGKITFKGDLPSTVKEIYSYCTGFGMPTLMKASVSDDGAVSNFEVTPVPKAGTTRANEVGPSGTNFWKTYTVKLTKPALAPVSREITTEYKNLIEKSFPTNQLYDRANTYYRSGFKLEKKATVNIYSVQNGLNSERTNALAYYVYNNNKVTPETANLQLVYPQLTKEIPATGAGYKLQHNGKVEFEAGSTIGFALFPDIQNNEIKTSDTRVLFSNFEQETWNSYYFPGVSADGGLQRANVPHMVLSLLKTESDGHAIIAIGFEDQPFSATHGTNKGDFRDDIFILEIDPASSLEPDLPTPPTEDAKFDGEMNFSGILCFEDSWPKAGDYDMNDVVISYERSLQTMEGIPVALKEKYTFLNSGADYTNGFGFQITGIKKSDVQKCVVTSNYECAGQGLDKTIDAATVMLFDNGKKVGVGTTFSVYTSFANGTSYDWYINPFIVVNGFGSSDGLLSQGRTEVHLPTTTPMQKFLPTSKADMNYFGAFDDKTDPSKNLYYVRSGNFPFALEINWDSSANGSLADYDFIIPKEKLSLDKTYPKFINWVESGGKNNTDWYLHPNK